MYGSPPVADKIRSLPVQIQPDLASVAKSIVELRILYSFCGRVFNEANSEEESSFCFL